MSYATDDAGRSSAEQILLLCRAKLLGEIRQETSCSQPDADRVADLEKMVDQLRDDLRVVRSSDRAAITRARVLYGRLVRQWYALASH